MRFELSRQGFSLLLVPLAPGGHEDHHIVREAAIDYVDYTGDRSKLVLYEDLPYCAKRSQKDVEARVAAAPCALEPRVIAAGFARLKATLLRCYPSQLNDDEVRSVAAYTSELGGERVWVSRTSTFPPVKLESQGVVEIR
jgi:hypothetical protein